MRLVSTTIVSRIIASAIVAFLTLVAFQATAQVKVNVRAGEHTSYGRLVLDWGKEKTYKADIRDGYLTIDFDEPFTASLSIATRTLGNYISAAEFYNDKKSVRFKLKDDFQLKTAKYGTALAFDLKKKTASPVTQVAAKGPSIAVRGGDHKDYSRIVVDWPSKTDFSVKQSGDTYNISFNKPASLSIGRVKRDLPKFVKSLEEGQAETGAFLSLRTNGPTTLKSFRSGNSLVFDFRPSAKNEKPPKKTVTATSGPEKPKAQPKTPVRKLTDNPPSKEAPVVSAKPLAAPEPVKTEPIKDTAIAKPEKAVQKTSPRSLIPAATEAKEVKEISAPKNKLIVDVGNLRDGFRLIFPWAESSAMAVFERAGNFWLVFDKRAQLDFRKLSGPYKFLVLKKTQIGHPTATIARLSVRDGYAPTITRTENEWRVDFRLGEAPMIKNTIDIQPQPASEQGARIFIPAVNNGKRISFKDPRAGDELVAVPLYAPGWGFGLKRTFAQFVVLPSMQGIAFSPRDSSVNIGVERNGISITADGGLRLAREISKQDLFADGDQTDRFTKKKDQAQLVKFSEWAQVEPKEFLERKQLLQRKTARAPRAGRNAARMTLAKFFVAHKFYADAYAVLERVRVDDPRADEDGIYRLLRGLSSLGLNHVEEAQADLMHPVFAGIAEVAPWRAKSAAALGDWKTAAQEFKIGQDAFNVYDEKQKNEFLLLEAQAALEDYDIEAAQKSLEKIRTSIESGPDVKTVAGREFLEGLAALRSGETERAIGKFDQVISLDYRPLHTKARYQKVNAELALKLITPEEAVEEFEKMSFAWRGDGLELDILKRVGDLQIAQGDMRNGLEQFRHIVMTFPKNKKARDVAREMSDVFNQLFLEGGAETLPPIKALALYYEYRELTPLGKEGDRMIRGLADRLILVDLLDQAAQLLDHQINFRLKGELKALTGTKLAIVHLWNDNPKESLNVLQKTRWRALPQMVKDERLHIRARAYSDLNDFDEALSLLQDDKSNKADLLRADIYWKSKNWPKAISSLTKLMDKNGAMKAKKLSPIDRQRLMQVAVARSLSNDKVGIKAMRKNYREKLVDTPDLDAFDLITEATDSSETEFRKRATVIAKVGQLESFMSGYREQLKNGEFWNTN
jgi:tetratricopeptide (TPR) repeat protein